MKHSICILGGTGFVGHSLAAQLVSEGHRVTIVSRRRERHRDLLVLPTAQLVDGNIADNGFLADVFRGHDVVINLVAVLNERRRGDFERIHGKLPARVVEACRAAGVKRLLHMSALHASAEAPSQYLQSKAMGERAVMAATDLKVTTFRPSVIFGPADSFSNRFAGLLRYTVGAFPLACGSSRFQPVYVEDVARAFVRALDDPRAFGQRYNLCGPHRYTLLELVQYIARQIGSPVRIVSLGPLASRLQAGLLQFAPGKPFTPDNYRSLQVDSVCDDGFPAVFGITPVALEAVAPAWLGPDRNTVFSRFRCAARRSH